MSINTTINTLFKGLAFLALFLLVSGCATPSGSYNTAANNIPILKWLNTSGTVTLLSSEHSQAIDDTPVGRIATLGETPWGESSRLEVKNTYFSASGKSCFITVIKTTSHKVPATLCKYPDGEWGVTRATTIVDVYPQKPSIGDMQ